MTIIEPKKKAWTCPQCGHSGEGQFIAIGCGKFQCPRCLRQFRPAQ